MKTRRMFLAAAASSLVLVSPKQVPAAESSKEKEKEQEGEGVGAAEDLMREHGALERVLLIYEEAARRLETSPEGNTAATVAQTAALVRKFVEDYHSQLEEKHVFPVFEKRGQLVELVRTLRQQHDAGRKLTDAILRRANPLHVGKDSGRKELIADLRAFSRMYRPHAAREDTVLFPALHGLLGAHDLHELGEQFEELEDKLFGEGGFEKTVAAVAEIEKSLGIHELAQFTPVAPA